MNKKKLTASLLSLIIMWIIAIGFNYAMAAENEPLFSSLNPFEFISSIMFAFGWGLGVPVWLNAALVTGILFLIFIGIRKLILMLLENR